MAATWGLELWDQFDNLAYHTQKGLEFLDKFGQFIRERCSIELEYAKKMRHLSKNYMPKKKDEEDYQFSHTQAFVSMTKEVQDLAGQHEVIAETFESSIFHHLQQMIRELKEDRKKHLNEGQKLTNNLNVSLQHLEKSKIKSEKAHREGVKAEQNFKKADLDYNLSRAEVDKARIVSQQKGQQNEEAKTEYANVLENYNRQKDKLYTEDLPKVFNGLQQMDERRIQGIQDYMKLMVEGERKVFPIINTCLDGILQAADRIDVKKDSALVIDRYKSGFEPPKDIEFVNFSETLKYDEPTETFIQTGPASKKSSLIQSFNKGTKRNKKNPSKPGIMSNIFGKSKPDDIKEDYSDLPPNQQRKKLDQKMHQIRQKLDQETATREGMIKMRSVYEQNPQMGDATSLDAQLNESGKNLDLLRTELNKFEQYIRNCENRLTPNTHKRGRVPSSGGDSGGDSNTLSRSSSGSTMENGAHTNGHSTLSDSSPASSGIGGGTAASNYDTIDTHSSHSGHSGHSTDYTPNTLQNPSSPEPEYIASSLATSEDFDDVVLGTCRALYHFEAENEGAIGMGENEEFDILEEDQGDGWTRVRRRDGALEDGFVPTSYIECFYTNQT